VKDKNILSFTISLRRMRPDFVRNNAAKAAKIRRRKRQSKKNFVVYDTMLQEIKAANGGRGNKELDYKVKAISAKLAALGANTEDLTL
ncbi:MAG: hypothetical protein IJT24_03765, partial [Lachnospiraceae bacterium]|nr:hypothetical protein [Lachnospiraceae bacterium]